MTDQPSEPNSSSSSRAQRLARRRSRLPWLGGVAGALLLVAGASVWLIAADAADDHSEAEAATVAPTARSNPTTTKPEPTTTTKPKPTTTTEPPVVQPEPFAMPELPGGGLSQGATGDDVMIYELRLAALHFDPGAVDGVFDEATRHAVVAAQKLWGAERTGVIDEGVRFGLGVFQWPEPMVEDGEPDRVEVDLDRQVMLQYREGDLALITAVSTGSGKIFCGGNDGCQYATTPAGRFEFQWNWNGWRDGDLGRMYQPFYFNGGIAIHGYQSVPTTPASHGCVRIPMHIAEYFPDTVEVGQPVYVVGEQAAPFGKAPGNPPPAATVPPPPPADETVPPPDDIVVPSSDPAPTTASTAPPTTQPTVTAPPTTKPVTTTAAPTTAPPSTAASTTVPPTTVPLPTTAGP